MKLYFDNQLTCYRTQVEAKASGKPWQLVEVPTDHKGLCDFINSIQPPLEMLKTPEEIANGSLEKGTNGGLSTRLPEISSTSNADKSYRNGDPIGTYAGSRDPDAIFICKACGEKNSPRRTYPHISLPRARELPREGELGAEYNEDEPEPEL